jgi:hypothetical protein
MRVKNITSDLRLNGFVGVAYAPKAAQFPLLRCTEVVPKVLGNVSRISNQAGTSLIDGLRRSESAAPKVRRNATLF